MPVAGLDSLDKRILKELQLNAKITNVELARRVGLSASPCLARVRVLEDTGVISRYVTLVNAEAIGLALSVVIQVTLERQVEKVLNAFEALMQKCPEVMECYLMTGDSDYMLRIIVSDMEELQRFILQRLSKAHGVHNIRSSFALKQVKYETALPLD